MFTFSSYSNIVEKKLFTTSNEPVDLSQVIKGKDFLQTFQDSNLTTSFRVFIKTTNKFSYNLLKRIGENVRTFSSYSGIALTISKSKLMRLIYDNYIYGVWENSKIFTSSSEYNIETLNYTQEIANFTEMVSIAPLWSGGYYGTGIKVAILDTGIKTDHPALNISMSNLARIHASWNFINNNENIEDDNGHGTGVSGIIGANGLFGYQKGIAPNCSFLIGKILDYNGVGTVELLIQGIDWAIENNADVINLSLGTVVTDKNSPEIEAVNNAVGNGTVVCVAAGNTRGIEEFGYNDFYTILTPGIAKQAITVGAIDNNNVLYEKSSAGPVAINYDENSDSYVFDDIEMKNTWLKPDVVAPGVKINTTAFENQNTAVVSGTSYSAAVVSGVCSILKEIYPENKPSMFKSSFLETSIDISPEIKTPLGNTVNLPISHQYQGAGLINITAAAEFLVNPPSITLWPSRVPFTREVLTINDYTSFFISVFINGPISSFSIRYLDSSRPSIDFNFVPRNPQIGQYDILIQITTDQGAIGKINFPIKFSDGVLDYELEVLLYVQRAKGRIIYDCNEIGNDIFYSMFGNLNDFLDITRHFGLIPTILSKDGISSHLSEIDLNKFEVIAVINHNSSFIQKFTSEDEDSILDYLLPNGEYGNGTIIFLPTRNTDINNLNNILSSFNISYAPLLIENETLDLSSDSHLLTSIYNSINLVTIPSPLEVIKTNDSTSTISDRFVYFDSRTNGGALIIASNNLEMFLNSPYFYSHETLSYEDKFSSLHFGDNRKLYENIMASAYTSNVTMNYSVSSTESNIRDELVVSISAFNNYGPIIGWNYVLTLETPPEIKYQIQVQDFDLIDYGNGNYAFYFTPGDFPISGGSYLLSVRSAYETYSWNIYLKSNISWGPLFVIISLTCCAIFYIIIKIKKPKK